MPLIVSKKIKNLEYIEQLKSLRRHIELYALEDKDWLYDMLAIDYAIKELENDK